MKLKFIFLLIFISFSIISSAQGKVCIAKMDTASSEGGIYQTGIKDEKEPLQKVFDVQIDKQKKVRVSEKKSICINNLSVTKKHLIKIYRNNILKESFWFTFDKYSHKKCLWYKGFYETWSLIDGSCR
jgi:hypothetical protein